MNEKVLIVKNIMMQSGFNMIFILEIINRLPMLNGKNDQVQ